MDPTVRQGLLIGGLTFCIIFAGMTAAVAIEYGFDVFTIAAILVLLMLILPLIGALREPPDR
jgi:hypothetical protein